jgi:hypothetical protein
VFYPCAVYAESFAYQYDHLQTLGEKDSFLNEAADKNYYLWLEHDAHNPIITVEHTEKGVRLKDTFKIEDVL